MASPRAEAGLAQLGFLGVVLGAGYLAVRLAGPILAPLATAAVVVLALLPLHERLERILRLSPSLAAALSACTICIGLAVPLAAALWTAAQQAAPAADAGRQALDDVVSGSFGREVGSRMKALGLPDLKTLVGMGAEALAPAAARLVGALARGARSAATFVIVFPLALFLFFRDGALFASEAVRLLPLDSRLKTTIATDLKHAVSAAVQGVLAVGLVQGLLAAIGFALFGVRFAALLGILCAVLSPIPFVGSALIWVPAVLRLGLEGAPEAAMGLGLWCAGVVGLSDNLIRPLILNAKLSIPLPVLVIVLVGGIQAFGLAGTLAAPLLVTLAYSVVRVLRRMRAERAER